MVVHVVLSADHCTSHESRPRVDELPEFAYLSPSISYEAPRSKDSQRVPRKLDAKVAPVVKLLSRSCATLPDDGELDEAPFDAVCCVAPVNH